MADSAGAYVDRTLGQTGDYYIRVGNTLRIDLGVTFNSSELGASYSLRLLPDTDPKNPNVGTFHAFDLHYAYSSPRWGFGLSNGIGIGQMTFNGLPTLSTPGALAPVHDPNVTAPTTPTLATPGTVDTSLLPRARTLNSISERAIATLNYRISRQVNMTFAGGYIIFGGLDHDARQYLTLQQAVDGSMSLGYAINSRFSLATSLLGTHGWNPTHQQYWMLTLAESGVYMVSPDTSVDLGVGINSRAADEPMAKDIPLVTTPVGSLGISHTMRARATTGGLRASITYAPMVDAVSGKIQNRFYGLGSATVSRDAVNAGVSVTFSQTVPTDEPNSSTLLGGSVFGGYQFTEWLGASLGASLYHQHFIASVTPAMTQTASGVSWAVFAGLFAVTPNWRF